MKPLPAIRSLVLFAAHFASPFAAEPKTTSASELVALTVDAAGSSGQSIASLDHATPDTAAVFNHRGNIRLAAEDFRGAIAAYTRALEISPGFSAAFVNRANTLMRLGDYDAAIADCNRALALDPQYSDAFVVRGRIQEGRGEIYAAIADYNRALTFVPKHVYAHIVRSTARGVIGDLSGSPPIHREPVLRKWNGTETSYSLIEYFHIVPASDGRSAVDRWRVTAGRRRMRLVITR